MFNTQLPVIELTTCDLNLAGLQGTNSTM